MYNKVSIPNHWDTHFALTGTHFSVVILTVGYLRFYCGVALNEYVLTPS